MIESVNILKIEHYFRLVIKHRWFIIIPLIISMITGIYLAITLPRVYKAQTLILVEPQRVPTSFVRSLVSSDINARISTISQQIMSRTNLEKIIKRFRLYSKPEHQKMYMEDKIENLRKRIFVKVTRTRRGADAFSISFKGQDPEKVMKIANTLATYFIDENLKVREAQAIGTSSFLDDELTVMRKKLENVEETMKEYRKRYMGELPEQLETNLRILDRLQTELSQKEESLRNAKNRLSDLRNMMRAIEEAPETDRVVEDAIVSDASEPEPENVTQLNTLKRQLAIFQTRYTERHPDVIKLKRIIAGLEAKIASEKVDEAKVSPGTGLPVQASSEGEGKVNRSQLSRRETIEREINTLKMDISDLREKIKIYDKRVENAPKREQELLSLKRDYGNIQNQYNSLLSRKLEAEISVNMERKQKGEQFRILDPARLPQKPIEPDMKKLFVLALAVGLGAGGGLIFLFDFFDTSFKSANEVETVLGVPVLATVPIIHHPKDLMRRRINLVLSVFSITITLILFAGFAVLTFKGVDQTMAFVGRFIKI